MEATVTLDPRSPWAFARRIELVRYAEELGIKEISEAMPKELIVKRLQALGIKPPSVPPRPIGKGMNPRSGDTDLNSHRYNAQSPAPKQESTVEIDADELLERQWQAQQQPKRELGFNEMRTELKAAGVRIDRRWNKEQVRVQWDKLGK